MEISARMHSACRELVREPLFHILHRTVFRTACWAHFQNFHRDAADTIANLSTPVQRSRLFAGQECGRLRPKMIRKPEFVMRSATLDDRDEIVRVTNAAYIVEQNFVKGPRTSAERVTSYFSEGGFFVASPLENPARITGSVYWQRTQNRGYFGMLSVDPPYQGYGLAKQLISAVEAHCQNQGCRFLDISVLTIRTELFPFYRRLGYASFDVLEYHSPADMLVPFRMVCMTKPLRDEPQL